MNRGGNMLTIGIIYYIYCFCVSFSKANIYKRKLQIVGLNALEIDYFNEITYKHDYYDRKASKALNNLIPFLIIYLIVILLVFQYFSVF